MEQVYSAVIASVIQVLPLGITLEVLAQDNNKYCDTIWFLKPRGITPLKNTGTQICHIKSKFQIPIIKYLFSTSLIIIISKYKKMKLIYTILISTILCYCQNNNSIDSKNLFIGKTIIINDFLKTLAIKGEHIPISNLGADAMYTVDTFLLFISAKTDTFYSIYSTTSNKHLLNVLPKGRGNNEFINISYPLFSTCDSSGVKISFLNRNFLHINTINITKSVKYNTTYLENQVIDVDIEPETKGAFLLNDSLLFYHYFKYDTRNEYYSIYNLKHKSFIQEDSIYKSPLPNIGDIFLWNNFSCFNQQKNTYATAMQFLNQINIYSLERRKAISLIYGNNISNFKEVVECPMPEKYTYYVDFISSSKYIFGLYANQTRKNWALEENLPVEIHVFDWDGNPKFKITMQEKLAKIAINEKQNVLYGMTQEEDVYTYNLSQIAPL